MRYCDWSHSRWEIWETPGPRICIDYIVSFDLSDVKNDLNDCLNRVLSYYGNNVSAEELEELVGYFDEFKSNYQF